MSDRTDALETPAEFNDELVALLSRATEADIDVEGGWTARNGAEYPDWDVVITENSRRKPRPSGRG
jgi:hypothetical protein